MTFRKKILLADLVLFLFFLALLFPFVETIVKQDALRTLIERAKKVSTSIQNASSLEQAKLILDQPVCYFESRAVFNPKGEMVWASHSIFQKLQPSYAQSVLKKKTTYSEAYSESYQQIFASIDQPVVIDKETYILRTSAPLQEIRNLTVSFEAGFLVFGTFILLLYGLFTWLIINRITRPIQQIIDTIAPYQGGREESLPLIHLKSPQSNEFTKLAYTLNTLSERSQKQIEYLKHQRKETEGILESLGEGVIAFNAAGRITFANGVACQLIGAGHAALMGHTLNQASSRSPDLLLLAHELVMQVLHTSETIVQTWAKQSGPALYLHLLSAPLAGQNGAILVLQNKTSDYKMLEMGKDFIANASHELRTPITVIRGFAETLHDLPKLSSATMLDISDKILRTSIRLEKLVKSLLTLSNVENLSREEFKWVDLLPIVEQCKLLQLAIHPEISIAIHADGSKAMLFLDADVFEMAIMNLLENAIKYSTSPADIAIRIQTKPHFAFEIEDKGIGIPEGDLPHIFDRFYTVDKARSRKSGGSGLGLAIVRTIVEKHGGNIVVFSKIGKGTRFTITS